MRVNKIMAILNSSESNHGYRKKTRITLQIIILMSLMLYANTCLAEVPVRISVKFIVDANGNRPATGNCNTDAEINGQVNLGNSIFKNAISELSIDLLEIVDVPNISQYFNVGLDPAITQLRQDALNNPTLYSWRNDAINIYVNGSGDGGIAILPSDNDIIMIAQGCRQEVIVHELGHSLYLYHTHENDLCADTIPDNAGWTRDQITQNNFGCLYADCNASQQDQADMVWSNVVSYHPSPRNRLSQCQMDRESTQGYSDKNWLYTKMPIYINSGFTGSPKNGSFTNPYQTLQSAISAGWANNSIIVLQQGSYTMTQSTVNDNDGVNEDIDMATRFGPSTTSFSEDDPLYTLPVDLENSKTSDVRTAIKAVKEEDTNARKAVKEAEQAARSITKPEDQSVIRTAAEEKRKKHFNNAINYLLGAEKHATGDEKIAIQLELAQRYRDAGNYELAVKYFNLVAHGTDQKHLREEALRNADKYQQELLKKQKEQPVINQK